MGVAAAAEYDTAPPHLRQNPSPAPSETTTDRGDSASSGSAEINRVGEMLMRMMQGMKDEMRTNMEANTNKMEEMRGEMRQMGQCLQAGIMATPRAGTNELGGVQRLSGPRWRRVKK